MICQYCGHEMTFVDGPTPASLPVWSISSYECAYCGATYSHVKQAGFDEDDPPLQDEETWTEGRIPLTPR